MKIGVRVPIWLMLWVLLGVLGGLAVAGGFLLHLLTPDVTRNWIFVGILFWVLTGIIVWGCRANIHVDLGDPALVRPELSHQEWKKRGDQARGWNPTIK